jgi:hypothetical protein
VPENAIDYLGARYTAVGASELAEDDGDLTATERPRLATDTSHVASWRCCASGGFHSYIHTRPPGTLDVARTSLERDGRGIRASRSCSTVLVEPVHPRSA